MVFKERKNSKRGQKPYRRVRVDHPGLAPTSSREGGCLVDLLQTEVALFVENVDVEPEICVKKVGCTESGPRPHRLEGAVCLVFGVGGESQVACRCAFTVWIPQLTSLGERPSVATRWIARGTGAAVALVGQSIREARRGSPPCWLEVGCGSGIRAVG